MRLARCRARKAAMFSILQEHIAEALVVMGRAEPLLWLQARTLGPQTEAVERRTTFAPRRLR